ncbi:hypothetical protein ACFQ5J_05205 [Lacticaseibacillus baoqingensis]|uniref:DUF3923 family protein n=1 Tax=Lacticaseibacillus baoqingensis TaxID=2486013 RepID=A0ABW4E5U2_9LACO|nr:hypothetical protein [Lacticaseibacillus baoqingensis]
MRKIWWIIGGIWLLSIIYFLVYVNSLSLQLWVNSSAFGAGVHIAADFCLFGGALALILHFISKIRRH